MRAVARPGRRQDRAGDAAGVTARGVALVANATRATVRAGAQVRITARGVALVATSMLVLAACSRSSEPPGGLTGLSLAAETGPSVGETSTETPPASSPATSHSATGQGSDTTSEEASPTSEPATSADDSGSPTVPSAASPPPIPEPATSADGELTDPEDSQAAPVSLLSFDDCESLLHHLRSEYKSQTGYNPEYVDSSFKMQALNRGPIYGALESNLTFSTFVTDGHRIYTVSADRFSRQRLVVIDVQAKEIVGGIVIPWTARALFLDGNNLLIIGDHYPPDGYGDEKITVIQRIQVEDDVPEIMETLRVEGRYVVADTIEGIVRVVVSGYYGYPQLNASGQVEITNTLEDWLPTYTLTGNANEYESGMLTDCKRAYVPSEFSGTEATTVLNLPISGPLSSDGAVSVMASGPVHVTSEDFYVVSFARTTWLIKDAGSTQYLYKGSQVSLHRFDISGSNRVDYRASGTLPDLSVIRVSIDAHDEHLRVVTTDRWEGSMPSSRIRVLQEKDGRLIEVGSIENIGRGKQVEYVSFTDDLGYVITRDLVDDFYPIVDPFYIIDLSDPQNPFAVGELEVPGFSSYLHAIDLSSMLVVGFTAYDYSSVKGGQISLFNMSDPSIPDERATWTASETFEDSGWNQRALLWLESAKLALFVINAPETLWAGAIVLEVDGNSITELGRITHDDEPPTIEEDPLSWTDCRVLDHDPAEVQDDSLQFVLSARTVLACEPGEDFVTEDDYYWCSIMDSGLHEAAELHDLLTEDELLWVCGGTSIWRPPQIGGGFVIDDELWTFSGGRFAVNDLTTLERIALIDLTETDEWPIGAFRSAGNQ